MTNYLASNLLLDQLVAEGVSVIFGTPCTTSLTQSLSQHDKIHYVPTLHEAIAVSMATGYSHASGSPGVAHVSGVPAITNSLSAILNAAGSHVSLIVLAEQDDLLMNAPGLNVYNLTAPFCKWVGEVRDKDHVARITRRAFHEALSQPRAPVALWVPKSTIQQPTSAQVVIPPKLSPPGAAHGVFLKQAAQLLVLAKKVAVIVGDEVSQYRARKEVVNLVEVLGCPAFSVAMPTGLNFPNQHPLFAGLLPALEDNSRHVLADYDVILAVGVQCQFPEGLIPQTSVVIQINVDLSGYALPCHFSASADLAESLSKLRAELQLLVDNQWISNARARTASSVSWVKTRRNTLELDACPLHLKDTTGIPLRVFLRLLDSLRPKKSIIVNDMGSHAVLPIQAMKFDSSASYYATSEGAPGYGLSEALGVTWASHEHTVICLTTDTSMLSQPQALWTASRCNLNVKTIVCNRQHYGKVSPDDQSDSDRPNSDGTNLGKFSVCLMKLANSMNVPASSVSSMSEVELALTKLLDTPGPCLLDVHIG